MSAAALRALHAPGDPLILPNAWDAGTARLVERAGFPAVATTSAGVAERARVRGRRADARRGDARGRGARRAGGRGARDGRHGGRLRARRRRAGTPPGGRGRRRAEPRGQRSRPPPGARAGGAPRGPDRAHQGCGRSRAQRPHRRPPARRHDTGGARARPRLRRRRRGLRLSDRHRRRGDDRGVRRARPAGERAAAARSAADRAPGRARRGPHQPRPLPARRDGGGAEQPEELPLGASGPRSETACPPSGRST